MLCFWCDIVDNTSIRNDAANVTQLVQKFLEAANHEEFVESDLVKNTVAYGMGAFADALPAEAFKPFLSQAVTLVKSITMREEAFSPENMEVTENAMGALAKIAYKHMGDGGVTEADLSGVLGFFPLKEDECEALVSHRIFLEQIQNAGSVVHTPGVKPAAQEALARIRTHLENESSEDDVKILSHASKAVLG